MTSFLFWNIMNNDLRTLVTSAVVERDIDILLLTESRVKDRVQHRLVIIAPAYNGYRYTLITALHHPDFFYPAEVRANALAKKVRREEPFIPRVLYDTVYPNANSDDEMQALVRDALQSEDTKAVILSLIAKSNEARIAPFPPTQRRTDNADPSGETQPPDSKKEPNPND